MDHSRGLTSLPDPLSAARLDFLGYPTYLCNRSKLPLTAGTAAAASRTPRSGDFTARLHWRHLHPFVPFFLIRASPVVLGLVVKPVNCHVYLPERQSTTVVGVAQQPLVRSPVKGHSSRRRVPVQILHILRQVVGIYLFSTPTEVPLLYALHALRQRQLPWRATHLALVRLYYCSAFTGPSQTPRWRFLPSKDTESARLADQVLPDLLGSPVQGVCLQRGLSRTRHRAPSGKGRRYVESPSIRRDPTSSQASES